MPGKEAASGRCQKCRSLVAVPDSYVDGDTLPCGVCGISLRVQRAGGLRLTLADVAPLRDEIRSTELRLHSLESDLARVRRGFGIGVNGLLAGVIYVVHRIGWRDEQLSAALLWKAAGVALLAGVLLELANFLFLGKRRRLSQLSRQIKDHRAHVRELQARIQEGSRR